jgi:hypothetical protein
MPLRMLPLPLLLYTLPSPETRMLLPTLSHSSQVFLPPVLYVQAVHLFSKKTSLPPPLPPRFLLLLPPHK